MIRYTHCAESAKKDVKQAESLPGRRRRLASFFSTIPILYINLENSVERNQHMAKLLEGTFVTRIEAVNGTDHRQILKYYDPEDPMALNDFAQWIYDKHKTVPGELANFMSHLVAMQHAHENEYEHVVIFEDDISEAYAQLWPVDSVQEIIDLANHQYPGWAAIRLQWAGYQDWMVEVQNKWEVDAQAYVKSLPRSRRNELHETWGRWATGPHYDLPLLMAQSDGWGNMAVLWSKEGLRDILSQYRSSTYPNKFVCPQNGYCVSDLVLWTHDNILVTTPPFCHARYLSSSTSEIRANMKNKNHLPHHRQMAQLTFAWLQELSEMFDPISQWI